MNLVILMGRLTKDPEIRISQGGDVTIGSFSIAVDRRLKKDGKPNADFFNCVTFNKNAEFAEKYLRKGTKIVVEGEIQIDKYEKDGVTKYATKIIANHIEFAESKKANEETKEETKEENQEENWMMIEEEVPFA